MIPDYQSIMLPLLKIVSDRQEYTVRDIIEKLSEQFGLTDEERKELLPSGQQAVFDNRVGWARTYMKKAGLLETPRRATVVITQRGLDVLAQNPQEINARFLRQFPEFVEFQTTKRDRSEEEPSTDQVTTETPEENLETAYQNIRRSLAHELLNKVIGLHFTFFEKLVVELVVKMGYGGSIKDAGRAVGRSGDEGIDGTIKEDKLGLDIIYIQAKRWQPGNTIGRPEIQKFVGALAGQGARKGIFITTSSFTRDAIEFVQRVDTKIILIDGEQLADLMIDHDVGVTKSAIYEIKKIDSDYFDED
jgi:restriction system protein